MLNAFALPPKQARNFIFPDLFTTVLWCHSVKYRARQQGGAFRLVWER